MHINRFNDSSNLQANAYDNAILRYQKQQIEESEKKFKQKCDTLNQKINLQKNYLEQTTQSQQINEWVGLINVLPRAVELAGRIGTWASDPKIRALIAGIAFEEALTRTLDISKEIHGGGLLPGDGPSLPGAPRPRPYIPNQDEYVEIEEPEEDTGETSEEEESTEEESTVEESFSGLDVNYFTNKLFEAYGVDGGYNTQTGSTETDEQQDSLRSGWGLFRYTWDDIVRALNIGGKYAITELQVIKQGIPAITEIIVKNGRRVRKLFPPPFNSHPDLFYIRPGDTGRILDLSPNRNPFAPWKRFSYEPGWVIIDRGQQGQRYPRIFFHKDLKDIGKGMFVDKKKNVWFLTKPTKEFPNGMPLIFDKKTNKWFLKKKGNPFNV